MYEKDSEKCGEEVAHKKGQMSKELGEKRKNFMRLRIWKRGKMAPGGSPPPSVF
jgi:hypothetical protein